MRWIHCGSGFALPFLLSCHGPEPRENPFELPGLHNVVEYADGLYSGSAPGGSAGFESLEALGIRSIISVDGAAPDVTGARALGMRYVHLPIGYGGMDSTRRLEISRALKDLPGPTYVHCHHGKHRSAGALGAGLVTLGILTPGEARARMLVSGTSPHYRGLYEGVASARKATPEELASASGSFPEVRQPSALVQSMVEIEAAHDRLLEVEKAGWRTPPEHPDLVPAAEAGLLADLQRNIDPRELASRGKGFELRLAEGWNLAEDLERGILDGLGPKELSARLDAVSHSCKGCHVAHRD